MLDPNYMLHISEPAEDIAEQLHNSIIKRIIDRIMLRIGRGEDYLLTATDKWQIETLQEAGILLEDIQAEIARKTRLQEQEIKEAMEEAGVKAIDYDNEVYKSVGLSPKPLEQSPDLIRIMQRNYLATMGEWNNFTQTIAEASQQTFINACDIAYNHVITGSLSYTEAVKEAVNSIASNGVKVVWERLDENGKPYVYHTDTIETATLRCVRTGVSQASSQIGLARMDEMGVDKVLISSHLGARPTHQVWQGKVFTKEQLHSTEEGMPAYGTVTGLCGANCRHNISPYIDGMSNPFEHFDSEENLEMYEKEQRQRLLERRIRDTKREVLGLKESMDKCQDEFTKSELERMYMRKSALLSKQNQAYNDYCEANGMKKLNDRISIARWDRKQAAAARGASQRWNREHGTTNIPKTENPIPVKEIIRLPERKNISFGTIEEAEEYCLKFVDKNGFKAIGKKSVNFKGLDVEVVNDIVAELDRVFEGTDIKKFDSIEVFGKVNKKYWERHQNAPMATSNLGNLFLNKEILKNKKAILSYNEEGKKAFDFVLSRIDTLQGVRRELAERYKKAGRSLVSGDLRDMLLHETGHHLSFMREYNSDFGKVLKETDWLSWSEKISGYAGHSADEYIAESWVAFNLGEDIQPEMRDIFERVIKNGRAKGN